MMVTTTDTGSTYLERHDASRNMARYYCLSVQPNLFGGWSLLRECAQYPTTQKYSS